MDDVLAGRTTSASVADPTKEYVSPRYLRLAMGGSHSVYILVRINLEHIGRSLFQYVASHNNGREKSGIEEPVNTKLEHVAERSPGLTDEDWLSRQQQRRESLTEEAAGYTVEQWCAAVRRAKQQSNRVFVLMHFFAGERRRGDVEQFAKELATEQGIEVLMISIDLATDHRWDFTWPQTFHDSMPSCS